MLHRGCILKSLMKTAAVGAVMAFSFAASAKDDVDLSIVSKIRNEGFANSQVEEILQHLTDNIGPRLTGTPAMLEANNWTKEKLEEWGLKNAHLAGFEFGPGWTMEGVQVFMTEPRKTQLYAMPISWHPGTEGVLEAEVIYAPIRSKKDFEKYKGKLQGKLVMVDRVRDQREPSNKVFRRHDKKGLAKIKEFNTNIGGSEIDGWVRYKIFFYELGMFLEAEGAAGIIRRSPRSGMLIEASGYRHLEGLSAKIPGVRLAAEHYARTVRLLDEGEDVKMSLNVEATFHTEDMNSYSTIAEIPGKGRKPEVVLAGAHLDSWFVGDGAVDNGAGVAVVMEAVHILKAIGVEPKRTIRVGLWGGEEQGYYGSQQYVMDHLASRPENTDESLKYMAPYEKHYRQFPISKKSEFDKFSAYFNLDNGSGKIRGVYAEGNSAAARIFRKWLKPFHDLGAKTVTLNSTGGTDHEVFDDIGLPGFQFIQDPLDYGSRLHHSQLDVFDHAYIKDLKQASVIMASFLYNAAMSEEKMPRKPMPKAEK